MKDIRKPAAVAVMLCLVLLLPLFGGDHAAAAGKQRKVILFVWDGLRPDSVTPKTTPNLWKMSRQGVFFLRHHATYPTLTMMNASSLNTGDFPGKAGFYGNSPWIGPNTLNGNSASNTPVDFNQPVSTEDWSVLVSLNRYYDGRLLLAERLLEAAQAKGLKTCIVGKSGPAFMSDLTRGGCGIDENMVFPESLAAELKENGYPLPENTPVMWPGIGLLQGNGSPTASGKPSLLSDGVTTDPTTGVTSIYTNADRYMLDVYLNYILPGRDPDVSVIWFRDPDSTEHSYGPGAAATVDALAAMDAMLGRLISKLKSMRVLGNTDILVLSDHGHSSVAGDASLFPLRTIKDGAAAAWGAPDSSGGFSVSGDVRTAQLLADNGIAANVYDGYGCLRDPVFSGILADGTPVCPELTDTDGTVCGKGAGFKYTSKSFRVPSPLPEDAVIVAANGGSDYIYVPNRDPDTVRRIVSFLQSREEFGAIFIDDRYGFIPGAFKMSRVNLREKSGRNPDIVVSFSYDENAVVQGMKGTEYESMFAHRGSHGSFSPVDVHNTLIALGPDFKTGFGDHVPSGNIDVAPTIAYLLGLNLSGSDGRVLHEALRHSRARITVTGSVLTTRPAEGLTFYKPTAVTNASCAVDRGKSTYRGRLFTSTVKDSTGKSVTYFDSAKAVRR